MMVFPCSADGSPYAGPGSCGLRTVDPPLPAIVENQMEASCGRESAGSKGHIDLLVGSVPLQEWFGMMVYRQTLSSEIAKECLTTNENDRGDCGSTEMGRFPNKSNDNKIQFSLIKLNTIYLCHLYLSSNYLMYFHKNIILEH